MLNLQNDYPINNRIKEFMRKVYFTGLGIVVLVLSSIFMILSMDSCCSSTTFSRTKLNNYINNELNTLIPQKLKTGTGVYLDFSDGMQNAYASPQAKDILKDITNKLSGNGTTFYSLANNNINALEGLSDTELYNKIMTVSSYSQQSAPIQSALEQIVSKSQPAILITDYEEYNAGKIQLAAYAKEAFTKWVASGYNIIFWKWQFVERGKLKYLFVTVFDDQDGSLTSKMEDAIDLSKREGVEKYVLGGRYFEFPMAISYATPNQGGQYHYNGADYIYGVPEDGKEYSFKKYYESRGDGSIGDFKYSLIRTLGGPVVEFYPMSSSWKDIKTNVSDIKEMAASGDMDEFYFLNNLYVNFTTQNSFDIGGIEVKVYDLQENVFEGSSCQPKEIHNMLTCSLKPCDKHILNEKGWNEIVLNFDPNFNFKFNGDNECDLLMAQVTISGSSADINTAQNFFLWEGNPSLFDSVKNAIQSDLLIPGGRILAQYYFTTNPNAFEAEEN